LGQVAFLPKKDINSAFCIIPIHPTDFELLGMKWDIVNLRVEAASLDKPHPQFGNADFEKK